MTLEQFQSAMRVISQHHSTMLKVNMPKNDFVGDLGTKDFSIHIVRCCAGLTKELHTAGFDIRMDANGMEVFKI